MKIDGRRVVYANFNRRHSGWFRENVFFSSSLRYRVLRIDQLLKFIPTSIEISLFCSARIKSNTIPFADTSLTRLLANEELWSDSNRQTTRVSGKVRKTYFELVSIRPLPLFATKKYLSKSFGNIFWSIEIIDKRQERSSFLYRAYALNTLDVSNKLSNARWYSFAKTKRIPLERYDPRSFVPFRVQRRRKAIYEEAVDTRVPSVRVFENGSTGCCACRRTDPDAMPCEIK